MPRGNGRKPDYNIWAASDAGKGRVGAAWINDDESVSLVLDPYVVLRGKGHAGSATTIMLYPNDGKLRGRDAAKDEAAAERRADIPDDDIPF